MLNTKFTISNTRFISFNAKFNHFKYKLGPFLPLCSGALTSPGRLHLNYHCNARFIIFHAKFIIFNAKNIILNANRYHGRIRYRGRGSRSTALNSRA